MTSSCNVKKKKEKYIGHFMGSKKIYTCIYIDKIFKKFKENEKEYVL